VAAGTEFQSPRGGDAALRERSAADADDRARTALRPEAAKAVTAGRPEAEPAVAPALDARQAEQEPQLQEWQPQERVPLFLREEQVSLLEELLPEVPEIRRAVAEPPHDDATAPACR
jgi:hypothetical protein